MANLVKFNMKNVPAALNEMYVRVTDTDRNELFSGVTPVNGEGIDLDIGSAGSDGQGVIVQGDNYSTGNENTFKSFSGYSTIVSLLEPTLYNGYKFKSNGTDNYIDLGFVPDEATDLAFIVSYDNLSGSQISGSDEFGLGVVDGSLHSIVNGVGESVKAITGEDKLIGLMDNGLTYLNGEELGTEKTVSGATLNLTAMGKNTSSGVSDFCNATWERVSWYKDGEHYSIDFNEGNGSTVKDNFGNEYTIQGTVDSSQWVNYQEARRVLIDTDMESDCDDVAAFRIAAWAERMGYIDIASIVMSNHTEGSPLAAAVDAVMQFHGREGLSIGTRKDSTFISDSSYVPEIVNYPHTLPEDDLSVEDALDVYRRTVQKAIDDGVKIDIVTLGTLRALRDFLLSDADEDYPSGKDMLRDGVNVIYTMGGAYPNGAEFNFNANGEVGLSTRDVLREINVPMIFSGAEVGDAVTTAENLKAVYPELGVDVVRDAYYYHGSENGRRSWDLMTMYLASLENPAEMGESLIRGVNVGSDVGSNTFTDDPEGDMFYAVNVKPSPYYSKPINEILTFSDWPTREGIGENSIPRVTTLINLPDCTVTQGAPSGSVVAEFTYVDLEANSIDFELLYDEQGYYALNGLSVVLTQAGADFVAVGGNKLPNIVLKTSTGAIARNQVYTEGVGEFARYYTKYSGSDYFQLNKPITLSDDFNISFKVKNSNQYNVFLDGSILDPDNHISIYKNKTNVLGMQFVSNGVAVGEVFAGFTATDLLHVSISVEIGGKVTVVVNGNEKIDYLGSEIRNYYVDMVARKSTAISSAGAYLYDMAIDGIDNTDNYPMGKARFAFDEKGSENGYKYYSRYDDTVYFEGIDVDPSDEAQTI